MKFSAATLLSAAAGVSALTNVTYTTEVVTAVTTFCPAATVLTHAGSTYSVTEATTLTITDCPCTITRPVSVVTSVACVTCSASASSAKVYTNGTAGVPPASATPNLPVGTGGVGVGGGSPTGSSSTSPPTGIVTAGAGRAAALSGAGLAGLLGAAAFFL